MRPADAIARRLQNLGLGTEGTTIFVGSDVAIPLTATTGPAIYTVISTGGGRRQKVQNGGSLRNPHFQIVARHKLYATAESAAFQAYAGMDVANIQIVDVFFLHIVPMQEPFDLGKDANGNVRIVFNVETLLRGQGNPQMQLRGATGQIGVSEQLAARQRAGGRARGR